MLATAFMKWTDLYSVSLKETRSSEEVLPQSDPWPPFPVMGRATETHQPATNLAGDRNQGEWSRWRIQKEWSSESCREYSCSKKQQIPETYKNSKPGTWQHIFTDQDKSRQICCHKGGRADWISRYWHRCQSIAGSEQTLQCCLGVPIANGIDTWDWRSFKNMTPDSFPKKHLHALSNSRFHYKEEVKGTFIWYQMKQQGPFSAPQSP